MNTENLTPDELISPTDQEKEMEEGSGQKLSVTLGSMELTEESLTNENFDLSVDFLGPSDRYTRPPLRACLSDRSYYRPETHTDSPCHPETVYSNIRNKVQQQNKEVIEAAVVNCGSGLQTAYDQLKSPATSRCVIL
ncbi:uncharacterized protein LOC135468059 [Liolophura sinensis]|uniref:uncharacterized protein LOC135468059 n=1 Tax=Liolophura sinensis TaxID=3198878 RepID=UPI003158672C